MFAAVPDTKARFGGFSMFKFSFPLDKDFLYSICILKGEKCYILEILRGIDLVIIINVTARSYFENLRSWFIVCFGIFCQ